MRFREIPTEGTRFSADFRIRKSLFMCWLACTLALVWLCAAQNRMPIHTPMLTGSVSEFCGHWCREQCVQSRQPLPNPHSSMLYRYIRLPKLFSVSDGLGQANVVVMLMDDIPLTLSILATPPASLTNLTISSNDPGVHRSWQFGTQDWTLSGLIVCDYYASPLTQ